MANIEMTPWEFTMWFGLGCEQFADYEGFYFRVFTVNKYGGDIPQEDVIKLEAGQYRTRAQLVEAFRPYDTTYKTLCDDFNYTGEQDYNEMLKFVLPLLQDEDIYGDDKYELQVLSKIISVFIDPNTLVA